MRDPKRYCDKCGKEVKIGKGGETKDGFGFVSNGKKWWHLKCGVEEKK
jgi:hypothetical protein